MRRQEQNSTLKDSWAADSPVDISTVFRSCLGYASTPGWAFIQQVVRRTFSRYEGLETIELGCGEGKGSLLFSLQGAKTTLVDNSPAQLERAKTIAERFTAEPVLVEENLLHLPTSFKARFDVSLSFGTAEHFFGPDRQRVFDVHRSVLRNGGLAFVWVPNRYGALVHASVALRKLMARQVSEIPEKSFTRTELYRYARRSGFHEAKVIGGESLAHDFNAFVVDLPRLLRWPAHRKTFTDANTAREELLRRLLQNRASIRPWNNFLSYPLILAARNA